MNNPKHKLVPLTETRLRELESLSGWRFREPEKRELLTEIYRLRNELKRASPTQPQSSLHELADRWREDVVTGGSPGPLFDAGWSAASKHRADELQAAIAAESELRGLEREVAETGALTLLHTNSYQRDDGWLRLDGPVGSLPHMKDEPDIRYLELRGLLERHPDNPELVRLKPAPPQEGSR